MVLAFVLACWWIEPVREMAGLLAPRLPMALYALAVVALLLSLLQRGDWGEDHWIARARQRFVGPIVHRVAPSGAVLAYLLPLFAGWETGRSPYMVGGLIPWSDATLYFGGAERVLLSGGVDDYGAGRPINPAFLAVRLAVTGMDLRKALIIGSVLLGIACLLLARTVARDLGVAAGLALFAGIHGFAAPAASNVMTESLGVTFGALALACIWSGARRGNAPLAVAGIVLTTVAQGVRSGTILLLPALVIWLAFEFRRKGTRLNWRLLATSVVAVALGLAINVGAVFATNGRVSSLHGHGGFVLYGLATGHPSWEPNKPNWTQIFDDNPGVSLTGADGSEFVNDEALRAIRENPSTFVKAVVKSGLNYVRANKQAVLAPIRGASAQRAVMTLAVLAAAGILFARRRQGRPRLVTDVALMAGVILSAIPLRDPWRIGALPYSLFTALALLSFLAFIVVGTDRLASCTPLSMCVVSLAACVASAPLLGADNDSARNFAASVPIMALPLAVAVGALTRRRTAEPPPESLTADEATGRPRAWAPALVGAGMLSVALIGAPIAAALVEKPLIAERRCPDGTVAHAFLGGVAVRLDRDGSRVENGIDGQDITAVEPYVTGALSLGPVEAADPTGAGRVTTLLSVIDANGNDRIAHVDGAVDAPGDSVLYLCGREETTGLSAVLSTVFWPKPVTFAYFTGSPFPERP